MAGIGFELKKLYNERGIFKGIRAFLYSFIVTVGPMVLCILLITGMQIALENLGETYLRRQVFIAVIMYAFIFSLLLSGGSAMYLSRFFADMIYVEKFEEIIHGLDFALFFSLIIGSLQAGIFLWFADIGIITKVLAYSLFILLIVVWVYSIVITALKNYGRIVRNYFTGVLVGATMGILLAVFGISNSDYYLLAVVLTFFVIAVKMYVYVNEVFKSDVPLSTKSIEYLDIYGKLVLVGFCMNAGIYAQNMVFWFSKEGTVIAKTFYVAPFYDLPAFYAFLTVIPAMVFFVIFFETNFFDKYREYYNSIIHGGDLQEMENSKVNMIRTLYHEYAAVMEIQLFFTILFLLLGRVLLPRLGVSFASVDIFSILTLGCFIYGAIYVGVMVLLYFDDIKGASLVSGMFFVSTLSFTIVTLFLPTSVIGLGFFIGALLTFLVCYLRLNHYMKNLDYYTYCNQPLLQVYPNSIFTSVAKFFTRAVTGGTGQYEFKK